MLTFIQEPDGKKPSPAASAVKPACDILKNYRPLSPALAAASVASAADQTDRMIRSTGLDGRYAQETASLSPYVCEAQLARYRIIVEAEWFRNLFSEVLPPEVMVGKEKLIADLATRMAEFADNIDLDHVNRIAIVEKSTRHDVIAMITVMREELEQQLGETADKATLQPLLAMIHLGLTSEDVSSPAQTLMMLSSLHREISPAAVKLISAMRTKAKDFFDVEDPNSPGVSLGARYLGYADRLQDLSKKVIDPDYLVVKFSGATGTHAATSLCSRPGFDPLAVARAFAESIVPEAVYLPVTAQINPHDDLALWCGQVVHLAQTMDEMCAEIWEDSGRDVLVGDDLVKMLTVMPEIGQSGSSAMPQKVQVIRAENARGRSFIMSGLASALSEININRLQRELSDSVQLRELFGSVLSQLKLALDNLAADVPKLKVHDLCRKPSESLKAGESYRPDKVNHTDASSFAKQLREYAEHLCRLAEQTADIPLLARTHNQPASPSTWGKEFRVFAQRLDYLAGVLSEDILGKPGRHAWHTEDVVKVATGVLTQLFDDIRVYTTQRNGALACSILEEVPMANRAAAKEFAESAIQTPEFLKEVLSTLTVDEFASARELEAHYECLGEMVQTVLRACGVFDAYERVKKVTQGSQMSRAQYQKMMNELLADPYVQERVSADKRDWLIQLRPSGATGEAGRLARLPLHRSSAKN